jgi:capsular polysaccharide biosynthesis protein
MNEVQGSTASLGFEQYITVLKRQWRVVAAATVLGALIAFVYLALASQVVTATTTINLNVITTEPFSAQRAASGLLDDATETAIARSHVVATRASEELGGAFTAAEIRRASTVSTSSGAAVVTVDFEADTAARAIKGADAVASAYLSFRSDQAQERIDVMVSSLTERIDALNTTLGEVNQQLASADPSSVAYAQATTQRQQILTELDGLLSERNGLQSVDTTGGIVLSAAEDNELGYAPGRTVTLLTGAAGGFVLGIIAAFVWNVFDRRLRNSREVSRVLGAPVFATVDARREDVPATREAADALRVTRERLLVDIYLGSTVLVIDATHGVETSPTAVNLAVVTAQAGHDVQVIVPEASDDFFAHLRAALDLKRGADRRSVSRTVPSLRVFAATDSGDERQGDLLLTNQTHAAIDDAGEEALTFLLLSSKAHPASILAGIRLAGSVVVVTRENDTTSSELRWIREEADGLDTPVLGAITERALARTERRFTGIAWPFTTRRGSAGDRPAEADVA